MYDYTREYYFRAVWYVRKRINTNSSHVSIRGRSIPAIVRQDEEFKIPGNLKSRDWISFITLLLCIEERNDYAISKVIDQGLMEARKHKYQGDWEYFLLLSKYFNLNDEDHQEKDRYLREEVIFSLPDYFDFLFSIRSEDDIFGNILRRSISLFKIVKIRKISYSVLDYHKVNKPQRHRGYRDHGSLASEGTRARRKANTLPAIPPEPKIISLDNVVLWGDLPPKKKKKKKKKSEGG